MAATAKRIVMTRYPQGMPGHEDLKLEEYAPPSPGDGELLLRTIHLSLDPYMRGRMSPAKSYAAGVRPGEVIVGGTVAEIMESRNGNFKAGDIVLSGNGWQTHAISNGKGLIKLDPGAAPMPYHLGVLGMPGYTAYIGLLSHGRPQEGETIVISAASGAVGQVVGQIGRIRGCRAVGVAGAKDKCDYVTGELGFDACVNYKDPDFADQLRAACPGGIDVYFENVGGEVLKAVLPLLNDFARVPVCGMIAHYNDTAPPEGPDRLPQLWRTILTKRISVRGFIVFDDVSKQTDFVRDMAGWLKSGQVKYRIDMVEGIENAVEAFRGLLTGKNRGKLVVKVGEEPD